MSKNNIHFTLDRLAKLPCAKLNTYLLNQQAKVKGKRQSKYRAVKTETDGIVFDSKKEANRYKELKLLERAGQIRNLQRQVTFKLPANINYRADFTYFDKAGFCIVEDCKGFLTKEYRIKKKLMKEFLNIKILET